MDRGKKNCILSSVSNYYTKLYAQTLELSLYNTTGMTQNQYYSLYNHDKANVILKSKDFESVTNCISLTHPNPQGLILIRGLGIKVKSWFCVPKQRYKKMKNKGGTSCLITKSA